jgi:uncharacterized protein (TIGR00290 family)
MELTGQTFFCSWSGGKDSCLSLYRAARDGGIPAALLTMMTEDGQRSRSHGLRLEVIRAQAEALGLPLVVRSASWSTYEEVFLQAAKELGSQGISAGVFGDIDLDEHRAWSVRVCEQAGVRAYHPIWEAGRLEVVRGLLEAGFQASIVAIRDGFDKSLLGTPFDRRAVDSLLERGIDVCGEAGEFHTVVTGGPMFVRPLRLRFGQPILRDGYWFMDAETEP